MALNPPDTVVMAMEIAHEVSTAASPAKEIDELPTSAITLMLVQVLLVTAAAPISWNDGNSMGRSEKASPLGAVEATLSLRLDVEEDDVDALLDRPLVAP